MLVALLSDKVEITKTQFEPWPYRYVGEKAAGEIYSQGICLEEYLVEWQNYGNTKNERVKISINPAGLVLFLCKVFLVINIFQTKHKHLRNNYQIK